MAYKTRRATVAVVYEAGAFSNREMEALAADVVKRMTERYNEQTGGLSAKFIVDAQIVMDATAL